MHYSYDIPVLPSNTVTNYVEYPIKLTAGVIKHVSILFPPGCVRFVRCTFWNESEQLLPSNPDGFYSEDSYSIEADCYIPTWLFGNMFYLLAWNTGTLYKHNLHLLIDVEGVDEPNEAKAVATLHDTVDSLVAVLKGFY